MKHLKRFKNWFVVFYYACWSYCQQLQNKKDQFESHQVDHDDFADELEASVATEQLDEAEVEAQQQQATLELLDAIAQGSSEQIEADRRQPAEVVRAEKATKEVPAVSSSSRESQSTPDVVPGDVASTPRGKYQPGAINEQTAQRLARLLVSEIKLYQKSKTEGEPEAELNNLYDLLKDPIEKSRQHYRQRMGTQAMESMPDYFHSELVRTLCGGDASRLGANYPTDRS